MCERICIFVFGFKYNSFCFVNLAASTDYYFAFHPRAANGYIETKCQKEKRGKIEEAGWKGLGEMIMMYQKDFDMQKKKYKIDRESGRQVRICGLI